MNDFEMNPMRTGLMFIPLGQAGDTEVPAMSRARHHLAEIEAEIDAVIDPAALAATASPTPSMLRRMLDSLRRLVPQLQPPSPTSV